MTMDLEPAEGIDRERLRSASATIDINRQAVPLRLTFRDIRSMPYPAENLAIDHDIEHARARVERDDGAPFEILVHRVAGGRYVVSYVARQAVVDGTGLLSIHDDLWAAYERYPRVA
jgi:hypothetical protein